MSTDWTMTKEGSKSRFRTASASRSTWTTCKSLWRISDGLVDEINSHSLINEFNTVKQVVQPHLTSQELADGFKADFTALKDVVKARVISQALADDFTALKNVVKSCITSQQTVVDKLDNPKSLVEPNARKMDSFGQAMETIKESIAAQTTKLDNMPAGGGGGGRAELLEVTAERDQPVKDLEELLGDPRLEEITSLDELFVEMGEDKQLELPVEIQAMDGVDRVGALAKSIKQFKQLGKNDLAGQVHAIQGRPRSPSGKPMIGSVLRMGQAWIAEPTEAPEVVTACELYTAWHFELSQKVSTLRQWIKAQAKQDKGK